jgi:hypothetical protein
MAISLNSAHLVILFPNLLGTRFEITSESTKLYNCIGWAATGGQDAWWEPAGRFYWPPGVAREYSIEAYKQVFGSMGYSECSDGDSEPGFEKIALYGLHGRATHAARQLPDGWWTSKLGDLEDIRHESLKALSGRRWGDVVCIMRRPSKL